MSYEYKEEILSDIGSEPNCNYENESNRYYDKIEELNHVYTQAAKADEYEAKNKELLEELKYLRKVNNDLVWQRDTDEEHEAKAESYTKLVSQINAMNAIVATNYDKDMTDTNLHLLMLGAEVKRFFESGEPYAKK